MHLINFAVHVEVIIVSGTLEMLFSYLLSVEKKILDPGIMECKCPTNAFL